VRGILYSGGNLNGADEPGNALKIYDGTSGDYKGDLTLAGPTHLLGLGTKVYVSCAGDKKASPPISPSVQCFDLASLQLSTGVSDSVSQVFRE
jgi:hypothetical protein